MINNDENFGFEYKYKWPFFWSIVTSVLSVVVPVVLIATMNDAANNFYYRVFGSELSLIAIYIGFYIYLGVKVKFKVDKSYWKKVLLFKHFNHLIYTTYIGCHKNIK